VKIEGLNKSLTTPPANETRNRADNTPAAPGGASVKLSSLSSSLAKAETALASAPDIDQAKVDEIRQAIQDGRLQIDPERIADGLLNSVRELLSTHK